MMADAVRTRYRRQCSLVSQVCADVRCVLDDERVAAILILLSLGYSGLNHAAMNRRFPCKALGILIKRDVTADCQKMYCWHWRFNGE